MKQYKGILLVLASEDVTNTNYLIPRILPEWKPLYPVFKKVYEAYMNENPNIKVFFVYGGNVSFTPKEHDLVYEDIFENDYPGMITKTMRAMYHIEHNYEYDFLIRTNLSTFWDLNKLENRLDKLPKVECFTGTPVDIVLKDRNISEHYVAGYDLVMSRDLVRKLVRERDKVLQTKVFQNMEDLIICTSIEACTGIKRSLTDKKENWASPIYSDTFSAEYLDKAIKYAKDRSIDHYRIKSRRNRNIDKEYSIELLKRIYGKTLL